MTGMRIGRRLLAAGAALVAGLGIASSQAQAGDVTFWTWRQEDKAAYTELFANFMKANPGINVKFEAFAVEQYATVLSTALAAGKGGDVIHTRAYGGLEQFAKAGYLLPLTYFTMISQGVMLRGASLASLWIPFAVLTVMAIVVFTGATLRFRRDLAPGRRRKAVEERHDHEAPTS